jgi:thymidine kinase
MNSLQDKIGSVEVICGSMFSGKTEELVRRIRRAEIAKLKVQVFKHKIDLRYSETAITSHIGSVYSAVVVGSSEQLMSLLELEAEVVAIVEAQFFDDELVAVCEELANRGVRVIVAGLDLDFRAQPFGPVPQLMAVAESVDKMQAICVICGAAACRTQRLIDGAPASYDTPLIMMGAQERYEARCRRCYTRPSLDRK